MIMPQAAILDDKASRVGWFQDARFGMFIHFGLYSIPAGVWNGRRMGRNDYAEWIRYQLYWPETHPIPKKEYDALLTEFNPTGFDADAWVREAKEAGMRYMVITTKHHDGFALWHSKISDYNVVTATPFKRDIIAELVTACRQQDIKVGFYYSHWQDWEFPGGGLPSWEVQQPGDKEVDHYWTAKCLPQARELLEMFSPDLFWFDSWGEDCKTYLTRKRLDSLITMIRSIQPDCLINSRIGCEEGVDFISNDDNHFPDKNLGTPWETSGTFNESWSYHRLDTSWKPASQILRHLVDNASRGGNYQLNVGPTGEGVFQPEAVSRLREIGTWMRAHRTAIYGTSPAKYPEPSWGRLTYKSLPGASTYLYAFVYSSESEESFEVIGVQALPKRVWLMSTDKNITVRKTDSGIQFDLPLGMGTNPIPVVAFQF
jgi:alpha-L-fucosidase